MAQGKSGRIVIEFDPALKRQVYAVLAARGVTLKDWFTMQAQALVEEHRQPRLHIGEPDDVSRQR